MDEFGMMKFWSLMGVLAVLPNLVNHPLVAYLLRWLDSWRGKNKSFHFFRIPQFGDTGSTATTVMDMDQGSYYNRFQENEMYRMAMTYVGTLKGVADTEYANVYASRQTNRNDSKMKRFLCLENGESVQDEFMGVEVWWIHDHKSPPPSKQQSSPSYRSMDDGNNNDNNTKSFVLKMAKKDKEVVLGEYLDHVVSVAIEVERKRTQLMLYSNRGGGWSAPVPFRHPSTFDTIALESEVMGMIKSDLDSFLKRKSYYNTIGRCWKRGYLFYGPPGTGKSSMIAAMANHLHFDVYDLELSQVFNNADLRNLLMCTRNKSILVIEDIDCTLDAVKKRSSQDDEDELLPVPTTRRRWIPLPYSNPGAGVGGWIPPPYSNPGAGVGGVTLSGILNCMDGLWSCCGEERIVVFTTNNKDKIDPALLRPGRMDLHVYFPHCSFSAFRLLARNYLSIEDHRMYPLLERAFTSAQPTLTPAEVAEIFLKHQNEEDPTNALTSVLDALALQNDDRIQ